MMAMTTRSPAPLKVLLPSVIVAVVFSPSASAIIVSGVPMLEASRGDYCSSHLVNVAVSRYRIDREVRVDFRMNIVGEGSEACLSQLHFDVERKQQLAE